MTSSLIRPELVPVAVLRRGLPREAWRAVAEPESWRLWALHVRCIISAGSQDRFIRPQLTEALGRTTAEGDGPHRVERRPGALSAGHAGRAFCKDTHLHYWLGEHRRRQPASSITAAEVPWIAPILTGPSLTTDSPRRSSSVCRLVMGSGPVMGLNTFRSHRFIFDCKVKKSSFRTIMIFHGTV